MESGLGPRGAAGTHTGNRDEQVIPRQCSPQEGHPDPTGLPLGHPSEVSPQGTYPKDLEPSTLGPAVREEPEPSTLGPAVREEPEPSTLGPTVREEPEPSTLGPAVREEPEPSTLGPTVREELGPAVREEPEPSTLGPTVREEPEPSTLGPAVREEPEPSTLGPAVREEPEPSTLGPAVREEPEPSTLGPAVREEPELSTLGPAVREEPEPSTLGPTVREEPEPSTLGPAVREEPEPSTLGPTVREELGPAVREEPEPSTLGPTVREEPEPSTLGPTVREEPEPSTLGPAVREEPEPSTLGPAVREEPEPSTLGATVREEPEPSTLRPTVREEPEPSTLRPTVREEPEPSTLGPAVREEPEPSTLRPAVREEPEPSTLRPTVREEPEPSTLGPAVREEPEPSTLGPAVREEPEPSTLGATLGPSFSAELGPTSLGPVVGAELETILGRTVTEPYQQPMPEVNGEDTEQGIVGEGCESGSAVDGPEEDSGPGPSEACEESSSRELSDSTENTLEDSGDFPTLPPVVGGGASDVSPPTSPIHRDEDISAEGWRSRRKHVFVLSEAGKPIYSRHGNEEALSSTMGVMMALVSFVQSGDNSIRSIYSDNQKVVFLQEGPLVLVSVSRTPQSEEQLRQELRYVYYQIISMLTQASVARIFERKKNYDLRRLLAGSEKILDSLLDTMEMDPGVLLGAVRCVAIPSTLRDSLSSILTKAITPNLVFSILVAQQQLVTVVQEKAVIEDCRLDPADLHLLLNLIGASSAFQAGEIWTPICLPRFNPDGYFYAYISYLDPQCTVCLVLLSTDKESFYAVSGCKGKIQAAMESQGSLQALGGAMRYCSYSASLVGIPELLHFVYKPLDVPETYRQLPQFTSPEADSPYASEEERQRLFDLYRYLHCRMHNSARPLRLIYHVAEKETLLAWVTSKFELYTAFSSLVTKVGAINVITKLLRWIKKEEDRLFIRYPPKYSTTPVPGKGAKGSRTDRNDPSQNGFFTGL
uniref:Vacuolar fusion protein MON1 homolog B n=1 Tax=Xenopus tropicalis TaxID=8364 RepID=A0A803K5B1_XENTR